jgi:hypothetical protein
MSSNGEIKSAATAASAVAIAAFGSPARKFQPAMIIVVTATTQIVATRVIFRIANLLPRPESACRDAGNGKFIAMPISGESASSPGARWTGGGNDTCELLHTLKKFFCRRLGEFGTQTAEFLAALPKAAAVRPKRHR